MSLPGVSFSGTYNSVQQQPSISLHVNAFWDEEKAFIETFFFIVWSYLLKKQTLVKQNLVKFSRTPFYFPPFFLPFFPLRTLNCFFKPTFTYWKNKGRNCEKFQIKWKKYFWQLLKKAIPNTDHSLKWNPSANLPSSFCELWDKLKKWMDGRLFLMVPRTSL